MINNHAALGFFSALILIRRYRRFCGREVYATRRDKSDKIAEGTLFERQRSKLRPKNSEEQ